jgi:hypothetical protein
MVAAGAAGLGREGYPYELGIPKVVPPPAVSGASVLGSLKSDPGPAGEDVHPAGFVERIGLRPRLALEILLLYGATMKIRCGR